MYKTLINLSLAAYMERTKKEEKNKERGIQVIIITPLCRCQEGYEQ
jgi:hypothetical protein